MLRNSYKIEKIKVVDNYEYFGDDNHYELQVWFSDTNSPLTKHLGYIDIDFINLIYYGIKNKTIEKHDKINKLQDYLDSEKGKQWLEKELKTQDTRIEIRKIRDSINYNIDRIDLEQLIECDKSIKEIINKYT